jgi:thioesterase domain-containing protein
MRPFRNQAKGIYSPGWSFGGIVALEAALQLSRMDVEIEGLLLIDSPFPIGHSPLPDAVISHATSSSEKSFGTSSTTKVLRREFKRNAALLGKYHPRLDQLKGMRVVMLKSKDVIDTEKKCGVDYPWLSSQQTRNEAVMKWNVIFKDGMLVIDIPGNHFEAFESDNVSSTY